jgi:hypothetical protein
MSRSSDYRRLEDEENSPQVSSRSGCSMLEDKKTSPQVGSRLANLTYIHFLPFL